MDKIDETTDCRLKFNADGLIPAIAQDETTGDVLMMAWMNEEALRLSLDTGEVHYWSRSRQELWHKGATSGAVQKISTISVDCDQDVLLLKVKAAGGACHTGRSTCFYRTLKLATGSLSDNSLGDVQLIFTDTK